MERLAHYLFSFHGRINRAKMWAFMLVGFALQLAIVAAQAVTIGLGGDAMDFLGGWPTRPQEWAFVTLFAGLALLGTWFHIAVAVKRLHDRGRSAWALALFYGVPLGLLVVVGVMDLWPESMGGGTPSFVFYLLLAPIYILIFWLQAELYLLPGTPGTNRFGTDPLAPG